MVRAVLHGRHHVRPTIVSATAHRKKSKTSVEQCAKCINNFENLRITYIFRRKLCSLVVPPYWYWYGHPYQSAKRHNGQKDGANGAGRLFSVSCLTLHTFPNQTMLAVWRLAVCREPGIAGQMPSLGPAPSYYIFNTTSRIVALPIICI